MQFLVVPLLLLAAVPVRAQVTVNNGALESLGPAHTSPSRHAPARRPAPAARRAAPHRAVIANLPIPPIPPDQLKAAVPAPAAPPPTVAATRAGPMTIPATPPAPASLAPPAMVMPPHAPPPPPPVPVKADAAGSATQVPGGLRVTFGVGSADLNPSTEAALLAFAQSARGDRAGIDVIATAPGGPDDPSTPRRLSLSRALAARAVLIAAGVPSPRIYVRAMGRIIGQGPPNRVDLVMRGPAKQASP